MALLVRDNLSQHEKAELRVKVTETVIPALTAIHNEYSKQLTVEYLAALCCMSVSSFLRAFKLATGNTPMRYANAYRISVAEKLLQNTQKTCEEISSLCGFDDPTYFNKCYKKLRGETPNRSRK